MHFKTLNISEASVKMNMWKEDSDSYLATELDPDFIVLRKALVDGFERTNNGQKYKLDYSFGLFLYLQLKKFGFTERDAANDDIWRFLSMSVVPDLVAKRWGKLAEIRYYKQSLRIWLRTIWWYVHLSWQGNTEDTIRVLSRNSTDQILQLVDRSGAKGYFVDVYRVIMKKFYQAKCISPQVGDNDFRRIMVLHTAFSKTVEPEFYDGGVEGYVNMLFERIGVSYDE